MGRTSAFQEHRSVRAGPLGQVGAQYTCYLSGPWDAQHLTTLNVLPSLLHHIGAAPLWTVRVLFGVWFGLALTLVFLSAKLVNLLFDPKTSGGNSGVSK